MRGLHPNDTNEAATIVWIFERYAEEMSPIRIASELSLRRYRAPGVGLGRDPQFAVIVIEATAF
ncbi:MAG TPA: hypothetical protein DHE23_16045 [Agrobacterium sp.]|nr:hypothetical protein [Agrobacterium sp.]